MKPAHVLALARDEKARHAALLAEYTAIPPHLESEPREAFALATIRLGLRHEELAVKFWKDIADQPPGRQASAARSEQPPETCGILTTAYSGRVRWTR